jgi:hypothetical protein
VPPRSLRRDIWVRVAPHACAGLRSAMATIVPALKADTAKCTAPLSEQARTERAQVLFSRCCMHSAAGQRLDRLFDAPLGDQRDLPAVRVRVAGDDVCDVLDRHRGSDRVDSSLAISAAFGLTATGLVWFCGPNSGCFATCMICIAACVALDCYVAIVPYFNKRRWMPFNDRFLFTVESGLAAFFSNVHLLMGGMDVGSGKYHITALWQPVWLAIVRSSRIMDSLTDIGLSTLYYDAVIFLSFLMRYQSCSRICQWHGHE